MNNKQQKMCEDVVE